MLLMAVTLKGDFAELKTITERIAAVDSLMRSASKAMAEESIDLIKEGFRTETDPYGKRWKPKLAADGRKTLSGKTSRLKGGFRQSMVSASGFEISAASVEYADYHQDPRKGANGRLKRPRRMMVPSVKKGLPRSWAVAFEEVAADALEAHYGGK